MKTFLISVLGLTILQLSLLTAQTNDAVVSLVLDSIRPNFTITAQLPNITSEGIIFDGQGNSSSSTCKHLRLASSINQTLAGSGFSITVVFKFSGTPVNGNERIIDFGPSNQMMLSRAMKTDAITFWFPGSGNGYEINMLFERHKVYRIALVFDPNIGTFGTLFFYLNGILREAFAFGTRLGSIRCLTSEDPVGIMMTACKAPSTCSSCTIVSSRKPR